LSRSISDNTQKKQIQSIRNRQEIDNPSANACIGRKNNAQGVSTFIDILGNISDGLCGCFFPIRLFFFLIYSKFHPCYVFFVSLATRKPRINPTTKRLTIKMILDIMIFQKKSCSVTTSEFWMTITMANTIKTKIIIVLGFTIFPPL